MAKRPAFADWLDDTNDVTRMFLAAGQIPGLINLAGGLPDPQLYPARALADLAHAALTETPQDALNYAPIEGYGALRDALATRYETDKLKLTRENVLITSGGIQGLELIGKVLLNEGGAIATQTPTYLGALDAWRPRRPTYRPMRPDANDFDPAVALRGCQFGYTVPNFSNPTGKLVPTNVRAALVEAAQSTGTWLVEDDPYGALYYDETPLPRMIELAGDGAPYDGPVIYLGSLSKELAPGLRIGWVIAAPEMIAKLTLAKQGSDMSTSGLSQVLTLRTFETGLDARVLPDILTLYAARRDALCAAMETHLTPWFDWEKPVGGMFVWAVARNPDFNTDDLLQAALRAKTCVSPSSVFDPLGEDRRAIRINFTLNSEPQLAEGIRRLAVACQEVDLR
ncbi:2-aminoadipate transaminase [Litoreibacter ponti]|uniref:2-aminoadipate transaminase n=1 Tax=Litoreibacter ponti TaxID=1510457 RepID=A0A2T6BDB6_9RHOB|nr:PLP-dependent aminotransferase family protein [Litoreibacter ponti]PTX54065.1 2-aminoadipate transaminase [Litoreibacter ponti]